MRTILDVSKGDLIEITGLDRESSLVVATDVQRSDGGHSVTISTEPAVDLLVAEIEAQQP